MALPSPFLPATVSATPWLVLVSWNRLLFFLNEPAAFSYHPNNKSESVCAPASPLASPGEGGRPPSRPHSCTVELRASAWALDTRDTHCPLREGSGSPVWTGQVDPQTSRSCNRLDEEGRNRPSCSGRCAWVPLGGVASPTGPRDPRMGGSQEKALHPLSSPCSAPPQIQFPGGEAGMCSPGCLTGRDLHSVSVTAQLLLGISAT